MAAPDEPAMQTENEAPLIPWAEIRDFFGKRYWLICLLIVLLGLALRVGGLTGFWVNPDEGIYYGALTSKFADFWTQLENNAHPPLYYLLLRGMGVFSVDFVWFRSLSLVSGCLTIWGTYLLGREVGGVLTGLFAAFLWAIVAAAVYYSCPTRDTSRHGHATIIVAVAAASHWFLDVIVHRPDLPLAGNESTKVGLSLWDSLPGTIGAELLVLVVGLALYLTISVKRHRPRRGRVALLTVILLGLAAANFFGPIPENMTVVAVGALVLLLSLTGLAAWVDRRRQV